MTDVAGSRSRLVTSLRVEPTEVPMVGLVTLVFFGAQSTHALSATSADTLFFSRFGVEFLPQMYIVLGGLTMLALLGYAAMLGVVRRSVFYPGLLTGGAVITIVLRAAIEVDERWVYGVVWLTLNVVLVMTLTLMWTIAGEVTDARSSKRLYPLFASAGILGGVLGSLSTGPLALLIGIENVLFVIAGILAVTSLAAARVGRRYARVSLTGSGPLATIGGGFRDTIGSPLLRLLAVAILLSSVLFISVVFPFSTAVADGFDTEAEIASFLGLFSATATAVTFLVSMFLAARLFTRIGVVMAIFVVAIIYVAGFTLWLASFTLLTASLFRFVQWSAVNAVAATAQTGIFNVLRSDRRGRALAFSSAGPLQLGVILGGALLWSGQQQLSERQVFVIGLALALAYAAVAWRMRSHYTEALVTALRSGSVDAFESPTVGALRSTGDGDAVRVARAELSDDRPAARRTAVEVLGRVGGTEAVEPLLASLRDRDVEVRTAALESLDRLVDDPAAASAVDPHEIVGVLTTEQSFRDRDDAVAPEVRAAAAAWFFRAGELDTAGELISGLLVSPDSSAREAASVVIHRIGWCPNTDRLEQAMRVDPSRRVRASAVHAFGAVSRPDTRLLGMFEDEEPMVRLAAGEAWRDHYGDPAPMLDLLREGPQWAYEAAIVALDRRADEVSDEIAAWAATRVENLVEVARQRTCIQALAPDDATPALAYLAYMLDELALAQHRVAVRVLSLLESDETVELILHGVRSTDVDTRAQSLEALESLGGPLGRTVVPLLEGSARHEMLDIHEVLGSLASHPNEWFRALAVLSVRDLAEREWRPLIQSAATDPHDLVRGVAVDVLARIGIMHETVGTMGRMERILALRQVPIFEGLRPDVLDHLAEGAIERIYEAGDVIMEPGDPGDELVVITAGHVDVALPTGEVVMQLGPGEYAGEITLLQRNPRVGYVTAVDDVRLLAIGEDALDAILREWPDVARAMLANLASRMADALLPSAVPDPGN